MQPNHPIKFEFTREKNELDFPKERIFNMGKKEDKLSHAHKLFTLLRDADTENTDVIYAPLPTLDGIGMALYNRMIRAAAHKIIKL